MKFENLPFPLGTTYAGDGTPASTDAPHLEGKEYWVECANLASSDVAKPMLAGTYKKVRIMRNVTGSALVPKRIAKLKLTGTAQEMLSQVNGYATTVGEHGYPIDEFLPAAGVADQGLFYCVVEGLAKVTTAAAGDTNIAIGAYVIPSTDGKVIDQDVTVAAGSATFNQIQGAIGYTLLAVNAINTDVYINVTKR